MKLTPLFLGLVAGDQLAAESGNLDDPSDQSMGAGITDHADDQFNQLSKAPTPAPSGASDAHGALHDDSHGWAILAGNDCHIVKSMQPNGRWCVQDDLAKTNEGDANYGNNEYCRFSFTGEDKISVESFQIEGDWDTSSSSCPYDWLKIGSQKYCGPKDSGKGTNLVEGTTFDVNGVTNFEFQADWMIYHKGFKLCSTQGIGEYGDTAQIAAQAALEAMPTSQPTSFPTKDTESKHHEDFWVINSQNSNDVCHIVESEDGLCVQDDPNDNQYYGNNEKCTFTYIGDGATVTNSRFSLESYWYDSLTVGGVAYGGGDDDDGGRDFPESMFLSKNTEFKFSTDYSATYPGFKLCVPAKNFGNRGSMCESSVAWADGTTKRPVGWVGAGPGADYCNVWKCEVGQSAFTEQNFVGTFRKQKRTCSVEEHGTNYCSHTSCQFTASSSSSSETKICDFESDTCSSLLENYGDNSYTYNGQSGNSNYDKNGDGFSRWSGQTYSYETGPDNAHKGTGHYMYTEASSGNQDTDFYLATKSKVTALEFWFHMKEYSDHMDGAFLKVEQSADGTTGSWTVLDDVAAGAQHDKQDSPFKEHSATSSTPMYMRIHARTGKSWGSDIAIDSVKITAVVEGPKVIKVRSDHREESGGFHKCGFSKHALARSTDRPACDCICHGARRQDAAGFMRSLNEVRTAAGTSNPGYGFRGVYGNHDATTDYDTRNDFDATHNTNNFYSQHSNNGQYVHTNAAEAARTDTYNQEDQSYRGQQVAHVHIDN